MEHIILFFTAAFTAVVMENPIFARSLGLSKTILTVNRPRAGILYGALLTWMVTVSSVMVAGVNSLLAGTGYTALLSLPLYLLCVTVTYLFTWLFTREKKPELFAIIRPALPLTTFNSALFGAFYSAALMNYGFFQTVGYSLGTGAGYTLAILIIYYARKRLAISPVPRSFRGLPVLLIYIGLLSLAIYGLIGHGLPS